MREAMVLCTTTNSERGKQISPRWPGGTIRLSFFAPAMQNQLANPEPQDSRPVKKVAVTCFVIISIMGLVLGICANSVMLVVNVATRTMALPSVQVIGPSKACTAWYLYIYDIC